MILQKDVFKSSEGDALFRRNESALAARDWSSDPVCNKVKELVVGPAATRVLEIGCGDGSRLEFLHDFNQAIESHGIDPSAEAVSKAKEKGINALQGTAEDLPFGSEAFDIVVFGSCLYLCDDVGLFRIAQEADRVLSKQGWLLILDFDAEAPIYRDYHHLHGVRSRKMAYRDMFLWHPAYTLASLEKCHHVSQQWTDDPSEWISLSCLRKLIRG